jgi:4-hydroxybenzoate polyprenyltransferase
MNRLKEFIERLENSPVSLKGMLITFLCTVFLRNFLETFSDTDNLWRPVGTLAFFVHYPLFYICLLLALSILFSRLAKQRIERSTQIVFLFFPVVLLAPILDLLISGGHGYNMSYLFYDLPTLVRKFIPFLSKYDGQGATPGIQIELIIAFILIGVYLYAKTGKIIKTAMGIIAFYITVFILGAIPSLVTILWKASGSLVSAKEMFVGEIVLYHFYSFNQKMALVLFPILIAELVIWLWCYDRRKCLLVLRNLRGLRVMHYICMLGLGMILAYIRSANLHLLDSPFPILVIVTSLGSGVLAWCYAMGINDEHDVKTDSISNPTRPLVSGAITLQEHHVINIVFLVSSLLAACLVRYPFFISMVVIIGLSYIYSCPPLRLKRIPVISKFVIAMCSLITCFAGFSIFSDDYSFRGFPPVIILTILVAITLAFNVIDIKDWEGDPVTGTKTLPVLLGDKKGKQVVGALVLLSYLCIPLFLKSFTLLKITLAFGVASYLLINRKTVKETPIFLLYIVFLVITLCYFYVQIENNAPTIFG